MREVLLGFAASLAAIAVPAAPAQAEASSGSVLTAVPGGVTIHRGGPHHIGRDHGDRDRDRDRRRHRRPGDTVVVGDLGFNDGWALYNNRTFEHDSYNDWWHERPWRSYPRWVRNNNGCERMWQGGGVWRCSW